MRLFPAQWESLHPAFPAPLSSSDANPVLTASSSFGTLAGATILLTGPSWAGILQTPTTWKGHIAARGAAYTFFASSVLLSSLLKLQQKYAETYLALQGVEAPKTKWFDRLGYFDADDAFLSGGALGVLVASRLRKPWSATGWSRWVSASVFGSTAGVVSYEVHSASKVGPEGIRMRKAQRLEVKKETDRWKATVAADVLKNIKERANQTGQTPLMCFMSSAPPIAQVRRNHTQPAQGMPTPSAGASEQTAVVAPGLAMPSGSELPHMTLKLDEQSDSEPFAFTNYRWEPKSGNAIAELEAHIQYLRKRRQTLAHESERIWQWLAEKEIEYHNLDESKAGPDEKARKRRYCEHLGSVHTKIWAEASRTDWMIADSYKRIEQIRSASNSPGGDTTWLPSLSAAASGTELWWSLKLCRDNLNAVEVLRTGLEDSRREFAGSLGDPNLEIPEKAPSPVNGKMVPAKQALSELETKFEEQLSAFRSDIAALEAIVRDGEKKSREARNNRK